MIRHSTLSVLWLLLLGQDSPVLDSVAAAASVATSKSSSTSIPHAPDMCCISAQSADDICGTCRIVQPECAASSTHRQACHLMHGHWCPSLVSSEQNNKNSPVFTSPRLERDAMVPTFSASPANVPSCCLETRTEDRRMNYTFVAASQDWCARSDANCRECGGTWCSIADTGMAHPSEVSNLTPATPRATQSTTSQRPTQTTATATMNAAGSTSIVVEPTPDGGWVTGTYSTGYWDCCKPSCSWFGKGHVTAPVRACKPDGTTADPNDVSVCHGGTAASCSNNQPFAVDDSTSIGFTAAAVSGAHGLSGDANCGQCYQLVFTDEIHPDGNWGGACANLVGKSHIVQITNIGYDVTGSHTFDLQIPGAGQGAFTTGCVQQFGGQPGDYDCDNCYGGCDDSSGCLRLPAALQPGCLWRYEFYGWLTENGKTNNPFVKFRRVKCPQQLTDISGSIPLDDDHFPVVL